MLLRQTPSEADAKRVENSVIYGKQSPTSDGDRESDRYHLPTAYKSASTPT